MAACNSLAPCFVAPLYVMRGGGAGSMAPLYVMGGGGTENLVDGGVVGDNILPLAPCFMAPCESIWAGGAGLVWLG